MKPDKILKELKKWLWAVEWNFKKLEEKHALNKRYYTAQSCSEAKETYREVSKKIKELEDDS